MTTAFPKKTAVWKGAVLGGIVNAIVTARSMSFAFFRGWVRNHYVAKGGDGRLGVITFAGGHWYLDGPLVGVFHSSHSRLFSIASEIGLDNAFRGCPDYQRSLAEQGALPFLELDYDGKVLHRVTATFWDAGEFLSAPASWDVISANGADLIGEELRIDAGVDAALSGLQSDYGMSSEQVSIARTLFERKMARPATRIELAATDADWLCRTAEGPEAFNTAKEKLAELSIIVPD